METREIDLEFKIIDIYKILGFDIPYWRDRITKEINNRMWVNYKQHKENETISIKFIISLQSGIKFIKCWSKYNIEKFETLFEI